MKKLLAVFLMIFGEVLCIYTEMKIARHYQEWTAHFPLMFLLITIAGAPLLVAYAWLYATIPNIWIVSIISITTIVIAEPILALLIFEDPPSVNAVIGFLLSAAGLYVSTLR